MNFLVEDLQQTAAEVVQHLAAFGYRLDFRPESLWEVDRFFEDHVPGSGRLDPGAGSVLVGLGGYLGEVLRRTLGGTWHAEDGQDAQMNIELRLTDGSLVWPVQRVLKRVENGAEDGIVAYGIGLGLTVGEAPSPAGWLFKLRAAARDPRPSATRQVRRWLAERRR